MPSVLVVGLAGRSPADDWAPLLDGRVIAVRHTETARSVTPPGCTYALSFDEAFERGDAATIVEEVVEGISALAATTPVAYLVPGLGWIGDRTVDALSRKMDVSVAPGQLPVQSPVSRVVDALELAEAEQRCPFDQGLAPLDSNVRTLVTCLFPSPIRDAAMKRIERTYDTKQMYVHAGGFVELAPGDRDAQAYSFDDFLQIVARLRRPDGCPWDREQTHASLVPALAEEVEEVASAVRDCDWDNLAEELGDVLLHVAMQAQIATEQGRFTFDDVVSGVAAKLIRRHPHVFGDVIAENADDVLSVWQQVKREEKHARQQSPSEQGTSE